MTENDSGFNALVEYLKRTRGFDLNNYKQASVERRVQRRLQNLGLADYQQYLDYLQVQPDEFAEFFDTLLINVTSFFRDEEPWDYIAKEVIPRILAAKGPADRIRIWSAGCATGEEPYTLAMLFAEAMGMDDYIERVKIYATDLDDNALSVARHGVYPVKSMESMTAERVDKYLECTATTCTISKDLRRSVIFGKHDLLQDAPISRVDLLSCRNTLMYFNADAQNRIIDRFHFALTPTGYLFLGKAEMMLLRNDMFETVDMKRRVFTRSPRANTRERLLLAAHMGTTVDLPRFIDSHARIHEVSFHQDPVAQLVVDASGNLVLANERARTLFKITATDVGRPLQDLSVSYRPVDLRSRMEEAIQQRSAVVVKNIEVPENGNQPLQFDLNVGPLVERDGNVIGVRFVFTDVTRFIFLQRQLEQSRQELETAYEELQSANEELTTTNEELQSTVEELETTNEELQSTNEELETMNEELQSTNEELESINREMQQRETELNRANAFLEAILGSLRAGVIVIDTELKVLSWNRTAENLWGLRTDEAIGQHLLNLDIGLPVENLKNTLRQCMNEGKEVPDVTLAARNRRGKPIRCSVNCMPLLSHKGEDGSGSDGTGSAWGVILLIDVLEAQELEESTR